MLNNEDKYDDAEKDDGEHMQKGNRKSAMNPLLYHTYTKPLLIKPHAACSLFALLQNYEPNFSCPFEMRVGVPMNGGKLMVVEWNLLYTYAFHLRFTFHTGNSTFLLLHTTYVELFVSWS